jgi:serine/threonine-protein kinase
LALTPGARLGPYDIVAQLGEGGMGQVYRAHDTRLNRDVALKVLPDLFAHDADRLARFTREAQTLAALNHPHIASIYGLEESDGVRALVMELVEGDDLSQRIARRAIPLDEALPIAKQIAEALEAAHEQGIIHRDLKPANIKVTPDGVVKVLDFGLAKLTESAVAGTGRPDASLSPTTTSPALMTGVGVLLGTAAYMAPEQARGKVIDKRADIWAFGCVVYEMLTGTRPFGGDEVTDTLAFVITKEPRWDALPANTPASIRRLLRRCLEKDRKKRLADIADARLEIDEAVKAPFSADGVAQPTPVPRRRVLITATAALVAGAAVAAFATWALTRPPPEPQPQPMRFAIVPPASQPMGLTGLYRDFDISPDGRYIVYTGRNQLTVRAIDQIEATPLTGAVGISPFISPDSRWVGFFTGGELRKVSSGGGSPITLCPVVGAPRGASWGPNDTIVFATNDQTTGLLSVPAGGGQPKILTTPDHAQGEQNHQYPSVLPGGRAVLFTIIPIGSSRAAGSQVAVLDLATGRRKILIRGGSSAEYVATGHLLYEVDGTLRAVRFDLNRLEVFGDPVPVLDHLADAVNGAATFSISQHGTLAYVPGGVLTTGQFGTPRTLLWVDRQGREESINMPPRTYTYPRLSPDGKRVALDIRDQNNDIWIGDFARQTLTRLTFDPGTDYYPIWTPDGRRIVFYSTRASGGNIYWQTADGTGAAERLTTSTTVPHYPYSMSPDGKTLVFQETQRTTSVDLSLLLMEPKPRTEPLIHSTFIETNAEISPDGHWLAYQSNESGQEEIYVRPFPNVDGGRWQISTAGGTRPAWARSGRELFYLDASGFLTTAAVQTAPTFSAAHSTRILNTKYFSGFGGGGQTVAGRTYDVSPDGQRFLMIKDVATGDQNGTPASIVVVLNWFEELNRLVPTK